MKCIKKNKHCKPSLIFKSIKNNYICSGISTKPSKFKDDTVWLCLKGAISKTALEMTENESKAIVSVLAASSFSFKELRKEIKRKID